MRRVLLSLAFCLACVPLARAQVTGPAFTFTNGTIADATEVNSNFSTIYANALNRTGGTMTATLNSRSVIPTASNTYDWGSATLPFQTGYLRTSAVLVQSTANYTLTWANPAAARAISIADPGGTDVFTFNAATQTLSNKTIAAPVFSGTSSGTYTLGGTATWAGVAIASTVGGTGQTSYTTGDLIYSSSGNTLAKRGIGSTGQVLTVSGGVPTWASNIQWSLLCEADGTDVTAAATNVATCAISGLTIKDTLRVIIRHSSVTQQTAEPVLYNNTDGVTLFSNLNGAAAIVADRYGGASVELGCDPITNTIIVATGLPVVAATGTATNVGAVYNQNATATTAWTGSWTLALRTGVGGVTAGGTYRYRIAVYKIAGA